MELRVLLQCQLNDRGATGQRNADTANCSTENAAHVSCCTKRAMLMREKMGVRESA